MRFGLELGIVGISVRKVTDGLGLGLEQVVVSFPVRLGLGVVKIQVLITLRSWS